MDYIVHEIPGHNTGVSSLSFLQGIFPTQGSTQVSHVAAESPGKTTVCLLVSKTLGSLLFACFYM